MRKAFRKRKCAQDTQIWNNPVQPVKSRPCPAWSAFFWLLLLDIWQASFSEFIQRLIIRRRAAKSRASLSLLLIPAYLMRGQHHLNPLLQPTGIGAKSANFRGSLSRALEDRLGLYLRVDHSNGFSAKALKLVDFSKQLNTGGKDPTRDHRCTDHGGHYIRGT